MAKNFEHLIHRNSSVVVDGNPKLPTSGQIEYGEIAINYSKDHETISIKNSNNEIVTFKPSDNFVEKDVFEDKERVIAMALINLDSRIGEIDVDDFATKEELEEIELGTATALNDLNDRISSSGDNIDAELTELAQTVEDNEKVTAMALVALDDRLSDVNDTLQDVEEFEEVAAQAVTNLNTQINTHKDITLDSKVSTQMHLPSVSAADNGKILMVVDGQWALVSPSTIYTGTGAPSSAQGNDGDIYLQTSSE